MHNVAGIVVTLAGMAIILFGHALRYEQSGKTPRNLIGATVRVVIAQ